MSVLGERYASPEMKNIWSREAKIKFERHLWISVMKSQAKAGMSISPEVISDYEKVVEKIDFASIDDREQLLHHDVKARIEEFNNLAGHEFIHLGMTSRDLTENIELYQCQQSLREEYQRQVAVEISLRQAKVFAPLKLSNDLTKFLSWGRWRSAL